MKKLIVFLLLLALWIPTAGCTASQKNIYFYYPRKEVVSGQADGVVAREERNISGSEKDLQHLLMLYLEGPLSQELRTPFPKGTSLVQLELQDTVLVLTLSDEFLTLEGIDRTIACAGIAKTCFGLGSFQEIRLISGGKSITLTPETVALTDNSAATTPN